MCPSNRLKAELHADRVDPPIVWSPGFSQHRKFIEKMHRSPRNDGCMRPSVVWRPLTLVLLLAAFGFSKIEAATNGPLVWAGGLAGEWNTTASNWFTSPFDSTRTTFTSGDAVWASYGSVFIGSNGVPMPVLPASASFSGQTLVHGGDITGPAKVIIVDEESDVIFSNYTSLSFSGGALLTDEGTLIVDVPAMPDATAFWFGTGPIVMDEGAIKIRSASPTRAVVLGNELDIVDGSGLDFSACTGPGGVAGLVKLSTTLFVTTANDPGPPVIFSGAMQIGEPGGYAPALWRGNQSARDVVIQGTMSTTAEAGPGELLPFELVNDGKGSLRFTGSNTFNQGCVIGSSYFASINSINPTSADYSIEVAPNSSLGTGDIQVQTNALLRLLGPGTIHPAARLAVDGIVYLPATVTVTCRQLTLGGQAHASGVFTAANGNGHIAGAGSIRVICGPGLPAVRPTLSLQYDNGSGVPMITISFTAAACQGYQIESTESLLAPEWRVLTTIGAEANERPVSFTTGLGPFGGNRFFRAISPSIR